MEGDRSRKDAKLKRWKRKAGGKRVIEGMEETQRKTLHSKCRSFGSLPVRGKFMKMREVSKLLRHPENVLNTIPPGEKNNVFCIIDDSENICRKQNNRHAKYDDDCGTWETSTTVDSYATCFTGKLKSVILKKNLFCEIQGGECIPLDPQPDQDSVIKIHRRYTILKGDNSYRRRITVLSGNGYGGDRALVEYCGVKAAPRKAHRLRKVPKKLVHSDSRVPKKISEEAKDRSANPRNVLKDKLSDLRDIREMNNTEYVAPQSVLQKFVAQVPDENQLILTELPKDPSVQAVIKRKDKAPCVILYSEDQFSEMKRNLECECVLGVDCTYKLGDCYVTMTVYQNSRALHKETNEPLLFLGPVLLHWDEELVTFMSFFSHILDKLEGTEPNVEVKLGSELMLSLFKALKYCLPESIHVLNTCHLEEHVTRELHDICGEKSEECSLITKKIFGLKGLVNSPTLLTFRERLSDLTSYFDQFPRFKANFGELQTLLYQYVCEPQQKCVFPKLWRNSSDEVLNRHLHILQQKEYELPELVRKISSINSLQMLELEDT